MIKSELSNFWQSFVDELAATGHFIIALMWVVIWISAYIAWTTHKELISNIDKIERSRSNK